MFMVKGILALAVVITFEFIAVNNQPNSTTAKLGNDGGSGLLPAAVDAAERSLQFLLQGGGRFASSLRLLLF